MNTSCKSSILKQSSSKWLDSDKPLAQHFAIFAFPQVEQGHQLGEVGKQITFDSILSQQRVCQKLPKSVDVH